jgi:hypothetical protein
MKIFYTRQEVLDMYPSVSEDIVFIPEHDLEPGSLQYFIIIKPLSLRGNAKSDFWFWCTTRLSGYVRCIASNTDYEEELWGFTADSDITLFLLRWGK